jgi:hypothetical protein
MATTFDRYMARGAKPPRRRSPRVTKHWDLLVQMQKHIDDKLSPNKAAVMVAKDNWRKSASKSEGACVQWLKDNQRKFRNELRPSTLLERLKERNAWLDRENPRWREELLEQQLRNSAAMREHQRRFYEEHPEELEKKRRAAEERERKVERWHEWFRDDPKAALAQLLDEIKRDEEWFDD